MIVLYSSWSTPGRYGLADVVVPFLFKMEWVFVVVPRGYEIQVYSEEPDPRVHSWKRVKRVAILIKHAWCLLV